MKQHDTRRKIDILPSEVKDIICDNCDACDTCPKAYSGLFLKNKCYEIYLYVKDELGIDDESESY